MKEALKPSPVFAVILIILIASGCSDSKVSRPWGISDETIRDIVRKELECDGINVVINNVDAPQTVCDQLGDCTDYADVKLKIEGVCGGRDINLLGVFRLYKTKLGNYRGEIIKDTG